VADFGYSTLAGGDAEKVLLPKSRPWNAPEHHFGEFEVYEAKKTDVYSFGMLCLWILVGNRFSADTPTVTIGGRTELISFDGHPAQHKRTMLEQLKDEDKVGDIACQLMQAMSGFSDEHKVRLKEFFSLATTLNAEKRTSDFEKLLACIIQQR
jgi:serine/threonine protein kinase